MDSPFKQVNKFLSDMRRISRSYDRRGFALLEVAYDKARILSLTLSLGDIPKRGDPPTILDDIDVQYADESNRAYFQSELDRLRDWAIKAVGGQGVITLKLTEKVGPTVAQSESSINQTSDDLESKPDRQADSGFTTEWIGPVTKTAVMLAMNVKKHESLQLREARGEVEIKALEGYRWMVRFRDQAQHARMRAKLASD